MCYFCSDCGATSPAVAPTRTNADGTVAEALCLPCRRRRRTPQARHRWNSVYLTAAGEALAAEIDAERAKPK